MPSKKKSTEQTSAGSGSEPALKYPKPKILLLDLPDTASEILLSKGFNVEIGTLGKPYKVTRSSNYLPLIGKALLPNYTEQDIVVVDLNYGELKPSPEGEKHCPDSELDYWAKCDQGFLDPRVRASMHLAEPLERIYSNGGVFVVFAEPKNRIEIQISRSNQYEQLYDTRRFGGDVWSFLSDLSDMNVEDDHGTEMNCSQTTSVQLRARLGLVFCSHQRVVAKN